MVPTADGRMPLEVFLMLADDGGGFPGNVKPQKDRDDRRRRRPVVGFIREPTVHDDRHGLAIVLVHEIAIDQMIFLVQMLCGCQGLDKVSHIGGIRIAKQADLHISPPAPWWNRTDFFRSAMPDDAPAQLLGRKFYHSVSCCYTSLGFATAHPILSARSALS